MFCPGPRGDDIIRLRRDDVITNDGCHYWHHKCNCSTRQAGVLRLHPHLLRHTYATRFLLNGGDVLLLKQNLGHTTLTMVEKYIHLANQLAAVASQKFSPLDSLEYPVLRKGRRRGNRRGSPGPHNGRSEALPPDGARRRGRVPPWRGPGGLLLDRERGLLAAAPERCVLSGKKQLVDIVDGDGGGALHEAQPQLQHQVP